MREYDYAQAGAYFVTVCAHNKECVFGEIVEGEMRLNEAGRVVEEVWLNTTRIRLDTFVVMPNHFHAIVFLNGTGRGVLQYAPTFGSPSQTVGAIVRTNQRDAGYPRHPRVATELLRACGAR